MPHIKNALIRYRIIDRCLRNKYKQYPTKNDLRIACEESLFGSTAGDNICDSTIEKDLFAMRMDHDAPIKYHKLHKGYYYEDPDFSINDIPLTENDLEAINFAAKTLMQFRDVAMFQQFGDAIGKIIDRVSVSQDKEAESFIQFEKSPADKGNEFLSPLLESIKESRIVGFHYTSFVSGQGKDRNVIPLLLKEYRNRWYLISFDLEKEDFITYSLDRMTDLSVSEEVIDKPINFNPDNYFKYAVGISSGNKDPENVLFETDIVASKYIQSQPFHSSQKIIQENNNKITFSLKVNVSEELIRSFLSYGGELTVVEPESLRKEMQSRLARMSGNYNSVTI